MSIRLLVSVRNASEAVEALEGGADIIDVKEPTRGALGFAGASVVNDVVSAVNGRTPVSVALGEIHEWASPVRCPQISATSYAKLGPIHVPPDAICANWPGWSDAWEASRANTPVDGKAEWVAVAYADHDVTTPEEILRHAVGQNVGVFLIDTISKQADSIFDVLTFDRLMDMRSAASTAGVTFALAGQIRERHLPKIHELHPDIVGVRGAVCVGEDRTARLSAAKVRALKNGLCPQLTQTVQK